LAVFKFSQLLNGPGIAIRDEALLDNPHISVIGEQAPPCQEHNDKAKCRQDDLRDRLPRLVLQLKRLDLIPPERDISEFGYLPTGKLYKGQDASTQERNYKNPEHDCRSSGPEQWKAGFSDLIMKPGAKFVGECPFRLHNCFTP
jgi:hypothetical protein